MVLSLKATVALSVVLRYLDSQSARKDFFPFLRLLHFPSVSSLPHGLFDRTRSVSQAVLPQHARASASGESHILPSLASL